MTVDITPPVPSEPFALYPVAVSGNHRWYAVTGGYVHVCREQLTSPAYGAFGEGRRLGRFTAYEETSSLPETVKEKAK